MQAAAVRVRTGRELQRGAARHLAHRQHAVLHHRGAGQHVRHTAERVRRAGLAAARRRLRREPLRQRPGPEGGHRHRDNRGQRGPPVHGHAAHGHGVGHDARRVRSQRAVRAGRPP